MYAEIITIGDEILIGQIIDTNSAFLGNELNKIGVSVYQITSVQDNKEHILKALKEAEENADIIIITGGAGRGHQEGPRRGLQGALGLRRGDAERGSCLRAIGVT